MNTCQNITKYRALILAALIFSNLGCKDKNLERAEELISIGEFRDATKELKLSLKKKPGETEVQALLLFAIAKDIDIKRKRATGRQRGYVIGKQERESAIIETLKYQPIASLMSENKLKDLVSKKNLKELEKNIRTFRQALYEAGMDAPDMKAFNSVLMELARIALRESGDNDDIVYPAYILVREGEDRHIGKITQELKKRDSQRAEALLFRLGHRVLDEIEDIAKDEGHQGNAKAQELLKKTSLISQARKIFKAYPELTNLESQGYEIKRKHYSGGKPSMKLHNKQYVKNVNRLLVEHGVSVENDDWEEEHSLYVVHVKEESTQMQKKVKSQRVIDEFVFIQGYDLKSKQFIIFPYRLDDSGFYEPIKIQTGSGIESKIVLGNPVRHISIENEPNYAFSSDQYADSLLTVIKLTHSADNWAGYHVIEGEIKEKILDLSQRLPGREMCTAAICIPKPVKDFYGKRCRNKLIIKHGRIDCRYSHRTPFSMVRAISGNFTSKEKVQVIISAQHRRLSMAEKQGQYYLMEKVDKTAPDSSWYKVGNIENVPVDGSVGYEKLLGTVRLKNGQDAVIICSSDSRQEETTGGCVAMTIKKENEKLLTVRQTLYSVIHEDDTQTGRLKDIDGDGIKDLILSVELTPLPERNPIGEVIKPVTNRKKKKYHLTFKAGSDRLVPVEKIPKRLLSN